MEAARNGRMPPTLLVGVHGPDDDDARLLEYVPGFDAERFAATERFFVERLHRWVGARFGISLPAERTGVCGASLGAELALALGLGHPDTYGVVLAASPGAGYRPPPTLPERLPATYLVAGTDEPFFFDNAARWATALRTGGADVVLEERSGGHGDGFWGEEFPLMLRWAFDR